MKRIGLIVNPIAGLGGRVGLKGSDGEEIQRRAIELGATPNASNRAVETLRCLFPLKAGLEFLTYPGCMGEVAVRQAGFSPVVMGQVKEGTSTAEDTKQAVREFLCHDLSLLLFAGGDGTARDIYDAGGENITSLGIPAGVKIHSAVYAIHPRAAGEVAEAYLDGRAEIIPAEVMDLDECEFRAGRVSAMLYGYLRVPTIQRYVQGAKAASPKGLSSATKGIAEDMAERMLPGRVYIFGPGSTTQGICQHLGWGKNLLGVDAFLDGKLVAPDANEATLLELIGKHPSAEIIVTPIGGQGCILGRGNQQISPEVIQRAGKENLHIVSTPGKIQALKGQPLWVDTGDRDLEEKLCGYYQVITGYREYVMYKVTV